MYSEIATAFASLKTITELTALVIKTSADSRVTEKAIELQGSLISLQSSMFDMQSQYQSLLREKDELEKRLIETQNWDREAQQYTLTEVSARVFAYALKPGQDTSTPLHWLCANCYQNKQKSILQRETATGRGTAYGCPRCKTTIFVLG